MEVNRPSVMDFDDIFDLGFDSSSLDDILDLGFDYSTQDEYCYDYVNNLAPGFRFRPTEEQLINSYLKPKLFNQPLPRNVIIEANIYQYNPKILTGTFLLKNPSSFLC
jgi:hypothetical protein